MTRNYVHEKYQHRNDAEIARLYAEGLTTYEIGDRLGISPHPVTSALKRQSIPLRRAGKRTSWTGSDEQKAAVIAAYQAGESIRPMAQRLHVNARIIIETLNEAGVTRRHQGSQPSISQETAAAFAERYRAGVPLTEIAAEFGTSWLTVRKYLRQQGVELRPAGKSPLWTDERKAEASHRYRAGESEQQIAAAFGCSQVGVSKVLRELGVLTRGPYRRRETHPSWKGGRVAASGGYVRVKLADEDRHLISPNSNGYVAEHRLVMARKLGRPLLPDETPHHKNLIRSDNDPGNLEPWVTSQPSGARVADLIEWSLGLLDRYMPEALVSGWQDLPLPEAVT